mgnify:FL=1
MERKTDGSIFAIIGGGIFTLCGIIIAAQCIKYGEFNSNIGLELFSLFGLAAALFLKKHEAVLGMAIVSALTVLIIIITYSSKFFTPITAYLLSYVLLALLAFISLNKGNWAKYVWVIPVVFVVLYFLHSAIGYGYFRNISANWVSILVELMRVSGVLFASLWLKSDYFIAPDAPAKKAACTLASIADNADRLKTCKSLLDRGAITEEEFQAKKAELLK